MSSLREAAQQLLEDWDSPNMYVRRDSYEALRAALSAQPEPAAPTVVRTMSTTDEIMMLSETYAGAERLTHREQAWNALRTAVERLVAAPTVVEPEPVAWMWQHEATGHTGFVSGGFDRAHFEKHNPRLKIIAPCYRHPPRMALTVDEAIHALSSALAESKGWLRDYSDAVIRDAIDRTDAWNRRAAQ